MPLEVGQAQQSPSTALILTGGGARAAYQVGVLQEIAAMRRASSEQTHNPFQVICGTSSGAINASVLACGADRFDDTLSRLAAVWENFSAKQVYRSDILDMVRSGARWLSLLCLGWLISQKRLRPKSLLDNTPLAELLRAHIDFRRLTHLLTEGQATAPINSPIRAPVASSNQMADSLRTFILALRSARANKMISCVLKTLSRSTATPTMRAAIKVRDDERTEMANRVFCRLDITPASGHFAAVQRSAAFLHPGEAS